MLIDVLQMELNPQADKPGTFEATLAEDTPGIGRAGERVTISLVPGEVTQLLGAGSPAAMMAKKLIQTRPGSYSMSATVKMDPEDSKALNAVLSDLALKAPLPIITAVGSACTCGHPQWRHVHTGGFGGCFEPECDCKDFTLCG